jgi:mannose-6-phosphate isomerase-like protein (cupin superfamily)
MFIRRLHECPEFIAGDNSVLRELLHPDKAELALRYSLAHAVVRAGTTTLPHRLRTSEVYYILSGQGRMNINGEAEDVGPGDCIYIPPQAVQFIANTGGVDLLFICLVDPAWRNEDEEVLGSRRSGDSA